ncbi:monovalent cation/H(+) antiporter subunit G [Glaciibacter superstes]|uniref:monovalent cation/H(+) antiporter subunit G n=1 Tax=Glaciibacter superstes TaxID=501023 RepID=UPI0004247CDD|nr:monovalent cation/H(+) antiporter subunit G [Glaciibacter superstes]
MSGLAGDIVTAVLVLAGSLMCLAAGVGLLRFPDVLSRLHAATKPQIFGLMAITADVAVNNFTLGTLTLVVAIVVFQALTAPMAAHLVARSAYDTQHLRADLLVTDELAPFRRQNRV